MNVVPTNSSDRLKNAAIELFAKHGMDSVSVRDIAAAANLKNAGSLNYYFRSKDELVRQIVAEVMGVADGYWKTGLDDLLATSKSPTVRDLVRVIVSWPVPTSPGTARFLAMFVNVRREQLREIMLSLGYTNYDRALALVRARLKKLPPVVVSQRIVFFFWASTAFLAAREAAMDRTTNDHTVWSGKDVTESFVDAMVGMFEAPVTKKVGSRRAVKPAER